MIFVDTNYFLRFLLQDNEKHFIQANRLLAEGTQGKLKLFTSTVVFFEVHWVLRSYYEKNRTQIFETLREILDLEFIQIEDRSILQSALEMFSKKALSLVGLEDKLSNRPNQLSGGEIQRVAIARALITNPSVIFADEPTGNLDTKSGEEIMEILQDLNKSGHTIVLVTHEIQIAKFAKRAIYLRDGKVVKDIFNHYQKRANN